MSLRILFADDSVTAQNMGRKILTEAGYEVVAVSNGAAAVKKIAEQKPDIIILDVYMPGYSGLEVCEKVRGSMETLKTPVLLTVGKMEPYKPEDANRVRADGVIVKPFEASDLLAIVKKFEERIAQAPAMSQQPVLVDHFQEEAAEPPMELPVELSRTPVSSQPTVEVPDHMATSSAFSDLLGAEPSVSVNHFEPPSPPAAQEATPAPFAVRNPVPDYELPVSWREREEPVAEPPAPAAERVLVQPSPEPGPEPVVPPPPPVASHPLQIPVYEDQEPARRAYEVVPTSVPPMGDIEIPREPELEDSVAEATRNTVAEAVDPGLMPAHRQFEAVPASRDTMAAAELAPVEEPFTPAGFQDIPADIVSHLPPLVAEAVPATPSQAPPTERLSDADFEARVAAAMSAYSHAHEVPQTGSHPAAPEFPAPPGLDQPRADVLGIAEEAMQTGVEIQPELTAASSPLPAMKPPAASREYYPPARELPATEAQPSYVAPPPPAAPVRKQQPVVTHEPMPGAESAPPVFEYHPPVRAAQTVSETQSPEAAPPVPATTQRKVEPMPAPPTPRSTPSDHHTISQAVHRVMERLKPELVDEILRELKSKKE